MIYARLAIYALLNIGATHNIQPINWVKTMALSLSIQKGWELMTRTELAHRAPIGARIDAKLERRNGKRILRELASEIDVFTDRDLEIYYTAYAAE